MESCTHLWQLSLLHPDIWRSCNFKLFTRNRTISYCLLLLNSIRLASQIQFWMIVQNKVNIKFVIILLS